MNADQIIRRWLAASSAEKGSMSQAEKIAVREAAIATGNDIVARDLAHYMTREDRAAHREARGFPGAYARMFVDDAPGAFARTFAEG